MPGEKDPTGKPGEATARTMEERGQEMFNKYQYSDEDYAKFLGVLSETVPGKGPRDVLNGDLTEEEMNSLLDALDTAFGKVEEQQEQPTAQPAGGDRATEAAAAATAAAQTAYAMEHGVVPANTETITEQEAKENDARKARAKKIAREVIIFAAGAAAAAGTLAIVGSVGGGTEALPANAPEDNADKNPAIVNNIDNEATAETHEGLGEYEDSLAGTYADAEDPTQINHNKLSRDGRHEAPYNFGESAIQYDGEGNVDLEATYSNAMERETWLAHHSTIEFAAQYALLSDGVKVPEAIGLDGQQLAKRMMEDEQFKANVVESFMNLMQTPGATEIRQITGKYANVYMLEYAPDGTVIDSTNTELKYCVTQEDGSYVLALTYQDGKDGRTHTLLLRLGCGFQPVAEIGSDEAQIIEDTIEPIEDPEEQDEDEDDEEEDEDQDEDEDEDEDPDPDPEPRLDPKTDHPGIIGEWDEGDTVVTPTGPEVQPGQSTTFYGDEDGGGSFEAPAPKSPEAEVAEDQSDLGDGTGVLEEDKTLDEVVAANNQVEADQRSEDADTAFHEEVIAHDPVTGDGMTIDDLEDAVGSGNMTQEEANTAIANDIANQIANGEDEDW